MFEIKLPADADSAMIEAAHIMDSLFTGLNNCQTREEVDEYLGREMIKPAEQRRIEAIRAIRKAKRELQFPC